MSFFLRMLLWFLAGAPLVIFCAMRKKFSRAVAFGLQSTGEVMNMLAFAGNHFKMPVFFNLASHHLHLDSAHQLGNAATHFKIFCDCIPIGIGVASLGDVLLVGGFLMLSVVHFAEKRLDTRQKVC